MNLVRPAALIGYRSGLVLSLFTVLTCTLQGQMPTWPLDGPALTATPMEMLAAAAKITPEKFAETTVLFEEEKDVLDAMGN
jgi:hypothetical protein